MSPDLYMRCPSSSSSTEGTRELCYGKAIRARNGRSSAGHMAHGRSQSTGQQESAPRGPDVSKCQSMAPNERVDAQPDKQTEEKGKWIAKSNINLLKGT